MSQLTKYHAVRVIVLCSSKREKNVQTLQRESFALLQYQEELVTKLFRTLRAWGTQPPLQVAFDTSSDLFVVIAALFTLPRHRFEDEKRGCATRNIQYHFLG
jgi:hypothetical protein